jgi:hypothetical protein
MDGVVVNPVFAYSALALVVVAGVAWVALKAKRKGLDEDAPHDTVDKVLWALTIPALVVAFALGTIGMLQAKQSGPVRREGDDDLAPDEPAKPPKESESDRVVRIIEDRADEVEDHVLNHATDDEVAARGAGLFDPGTPSGDGDPPTDVS